MNTGQMIQKYIELRDYVAVLNAQHEAAVKQYKDGMTAIENALLAEMNALGPDTQNIKVNGIGTAFKKKWTSATMADRPTFMAFVSDDFDKRSDFLTSAITKKEVEEFIEAHGSPPPGVNFSQGVQVNIRRD